MTQASQASLFEEQRAVQPPPSDEQCEQTRRATHRVKILAMLRRGTVTSTELVGVSHRFSARIEELRKRFGHVIKTEQDRRRGISWYTLQHDSGRDAQ